MPVGEARSTQRCERLVGLYTILPLPILYGVWCMAYARGGSGGSYIAQWSCNSIALLWGMQVGEGNTRMIDSCIKASK